MHASRAHLLAERDDEARASVSPGRSPWRDLARGIRHDRRVLTRSDAAIRSDIRPGFAPVAQRGTVKSFRARPRIA